MKKILALLLVLLMVLTGCTSKPDDNDDPTPTPPVTKMPKSSTWYANDGSVYCEITFDEQGRYVTYAYESGYGIYTSKIEYAKDGSYEVDVTYDENDQLLWGNRYEYNDKGDYIAIYDIDSNGNESLICTFKNEYNDKGQLVKQVEHFAEAESDEFDFISTFTYNDKGLKIKEEYVCNYEEYDEDNYRYLYTYDSNDNVVEYHSFNISSETEGYYELYHYNEDGLIDKCTIWPYDGEGNSMTFTIEYQY